MSLIYSKETKHRSETSPLHRGEHWSDIPADLPGVRVPHPQGQVVQRRQGDTG